jgi:hypothetical protein
VSSEHCRRGREIAAEGMAMEDEAMAMTTLLRAAWADLYCSGERFEKQLVAEAPTSP